MNFSPGLTPINLYFLFGVIALIKSKIWKLGILGINISPSYFLKKIKLIH